MWRKLRTIRNVYAAAAMTAVSLGGCVTPNADEIGPYPTDFKSILQQHIEETFFDPYSMRSVKVSTPRQGHIFFRQGWDVCFQVNARNRMGGYVGLTRYAYLLNRGAVVNSMKEPPWCRGVPLVPWPEMDSGT